ncbi:MAG: sodium:solute symporter family protein [Candidatus Aminicenantes bacterium]|nr:sodium:solute symporter family protein [Candidatus Aminicenantes bacterium]
MSLTAAIIAAYLVILVGLGALARRRSGATHEAFFLANRALGPVLLLLTMSATNFSAFTVLGFSGAGYRIGWAYYPVMAFGTGFIALTFLFIGIPAMRAARELGAVTPPELIRLRLPNRALHAAYTLVMVVFTLPYLALQPMGAGYALKELAGVPYEWGAGIVVAVGVAYVLLGGLRGDVLTDAFQGLLMLATLAVLLFAAARAFGGFAAAGASAAATAPALFGRPGGGGFFTPGIWFSYMLLWSLCNPMFPQLFQRFLAAKGSRVIKTTALLYPLITGVLFFIPVALGVFGRLAVPGLEGKAADSVLPLLIARLLPPWAGAVALVAVLAALMSTMDSQLLTLSSMVIRDGAAIAGAAVPRRPLPRSMAIVGLALAGFLLALRPWAPLLEIATEAFSGLAVLFPVTVAALWWRRTNAWAGLASIVAGETLVVLYHFKLLPSFGLLPAIPAVAAAAVVLVAGSLVRPGDSKPAMNPPRRWPVWAVGFAALFALACDFWNWGDARLGWLAMPRWLWYHIGLVAALFALLFVALRARRRHEAPNTR